MSFILPTLLVMTQSVGLALPTLNTTSAHVPSWSSSCDGLYHFRSLLSLVWSCLSTTFLCTWVAMHPNVPAEGDTAWVKRFTSSLSYLAGMLIAPEAIVFRAFQEWIVACNLIKTLASKRHTNAQWTETHGMTVVMGGFDAVNGDDPTKTRLSDKNFERQLEIYDIDFSTVSKDVIMDKSKGDVIAKALVVFQTNWFAIQCITRATQGIPVTELELTTLGHTAFICFIYFFWWNKPLGVVYPLTLRAKPRTDASGKFKTEGRAGAEVKGGGANSVKVQSLSWRIRFGGYLYKDNILEFRYESAMSDFLRLTFILLVARTFGAIHCLGWNSDFPSRVEQTIWRASTLIVTVSPIVILAADEVYGVTTPLGIILIGIYVCARLCLLTVAFLSLRHLSFAAHQTLSWTSFLPHL